MRTTDLNLTTKELKVLTWNDDVTGMAAYLTGETVRIVYKAMPSYSPVVMHVDDVILSLEDMRKIEVERLIAGN